jgi:FkbM family methyltransferase
MHFTLYHHFRGWLHHFRGWRRVHIGKNEFRVNTSNHSFWNSVDSGRWEPETLAILQATLKPGNIYCDIGAWVGPTVLFAHSCGAKVYCFEPDPIAYECLLENLRLNGAFSIRTFQCALGKTDGPRTMGAMVGSLGKSATSLFGVNARQTVSVTGLRWETAKRCFQLPDFDFLKIDIEGGEVELLPQLIEFLRERKPTLLLSTHYSFLPEKERTLLASLLADLDEIYRSAESITSNQRKPVDLRDPNILPSHSVFFLTK